jgi:hypothetical protein
MRFRFFADHCVSNAIMHILRAGGHEAIRLCEQLPVESPDAVQARVRRQTHGIKGSFMIELR